MQRADPELRTGALRLLCTIAVVVAGVGCGDAAEERHAIEIVANEYAFTPDEVRAPARQLVRLRLRNAGDMPHNLTFPTLGQGTKDVAPGETGELELALPGPGTYPFECTITDHATRGLTGKLVRAAP